MKLQKLIPVLFAALALTACDNVSSGGNTPDVFKITTTALPAGVSNAAYNAQLSTAFGTGAVTFAWQSGYTPPTWLSLGANGLLSGTPTATGSVTLEVQATDSAAVPAVVIKNLTLNVADAPTIDTSTLARAVKGIAYSEQLAFTALAGLNPTWQLAAGSTLPTGISLSSSGLLSGTTSDGGLFPLEVELLLGAAVADTSTLDLVVYESIPYSYVEDALETPTPNDSTGDATNMGALDMQNPIVQTAPLSLNSNPNITKPDPDDYFAFTISTVGTIDIEVFFKGLAGELNAYLWFYAGAPTHQVSVVAASTGYQTDDETILHHNAQLSGGATGYYYLQVTAPYDSTSQLANSNAYSFRISFNDLAISTESLEADSNGGGAIDQQVVATTQGAPLGSPNWSLTGGTLPAGVSFGTDGRFTGTPTEFGMYDFTVQAEDGGSSLERDIQVRFFDSVAGDYWQVRGKRLKYDAGGNDTEWDSYAEATVVAPHPDYPTEGGIYVLGGTDLSTLSTIDNVRVFHTDRAGIPAAKHFKFEDNIPSLTIARRYFSAVFLQHSYGGYIYIAGGAVGAPSGAHATGDFWYEVQRLMVADGSGNALTHPLSSTWEAVTSLPQTEGTLNIKGWAEFGLIANDKAADGDDRIYLVGGRCQIEDSVGSNTFTKTFHDAVLMYECPLTVSATGTWHRKTDTTPYTPRRFPSVSIISDRIYIIGGRQGVAGQGGGGSTMLNSVEMYQPDPTSSNVATATTSSSGFPTLTEGAYYSGFGTIGNSLYLWCGWNSSFQGTKYLHRFDPNGSGTGGTLTRLTDADWGTGFGSGVAHDGKLWIFSGIGHGSADEPSNLQYNP